MKKFNTFTLAEVFHPAQQSCKIAFTLAEVLITLGIIGVVAALTMPSLINNYKINKKVNLLNQSYSIMQHAFMMAIKEHGESRYWDCPSTETGKYDENNKQILDMSGAEQLIKYLSENINHTKTTKPFVHKESPLHGATKTSIETPKEQYIHLNNGSIIIAGYTSKPRMTGDLVVILPGCEKSVCKEGIDTFHFKVDYLKSRIVPFGSPAPALTSLNIPQFETHCNINKNISLNGFGCTAWVVYNKNMDYLHCDDLSWNGKRKCN